MPDSNAVPPAEQGITPGDAAIVLPAYHKCLPCAELGRTCGGQKLAALGSIEAVRAYHRALKAARKIQLKQIYPAAPQIGHGTIEDYFGRSGQDFKWTTVTAIDSALVAICGDRVGQPLPETPCPFALAEMQERMEKAEAEAERLSKALATAEEKHLLTLRDQHGVMQAQLEFAQERMRSAEARAEDYLRRNDEKRLQIEKLHEDIRTLNAQLIKMAADHATEIRLLAGRVLDLSGK